MEKRLRCITTAHVFRTQCRTMSNEESLTLGRVEGADVVLDQPSVSSRHARLVRRGAQVFIEDSGSANGTWVNGHRVPHAQIQVGMDVRLGEASLPWHHPRIAQFMRPQKAHDAGKGMTRTMVAMPVFGRYTCPTCKSTQILPQGFVRGELTCPKCKETLTFGESGSMLGKVFRAVSGLAVGVTLSAVAALSMGLIFAPAEFTEAPDPVGAWARARLGPRIVQEGIAVSPVEEILGPQGPPVGSPEEAAVRAHSADEIRDAIDASSPITRSLAVQVAAEDDGPFHVEQVARIWKHVRLAWRYVNDPRGTDYYARASETITNEFAGDCDDFAITLVAMIEAIGGRARIVIMDSAEGGHAYAEVCIEGPPNEVSQKVARFYRRSWDRRLGTRPAQTLLHFRTDAGCTMWLNLDWSTTVIGGPYVEERYAIAVYSDGTTETLAPARPNATTGDTPTERTNLPQRAPL